VSGRKRDRIRSLSVYAKRQEHGGDGDLNKHSHDVCLSVVGG
jgi:hypothetical protein